MTDQENQQEKELFNKQYLPIFTEYLDQAKLEKKIPSYKYLNEELHKLEVTTNDSTYQHVMSKKVLLLSKNAKQLCRDGIPLKYLKPVLLKMFNVGFTKADYENKKAEVLKGRNLSDMEKIVPTFCNRSLEDTIPDNYLNEKGIEALKEILWLLNGVFLRMEYCPALTVIASFLLLFLSKEETYELLRNIIEADEKPGEINTLRWHFRYTLNENIKLHLAITNSILEISKERIVSQFKMIENYGLPKFRLIQDMADKFFIDYINFVGMIKFLPFFLYEGVKGIYRFAYGLIAVCPFRLVKEKEEDPNKLVTLTNQIAQEFDYDKRSPEEVLRLFKEVTNKLENWYYFFDHATEWELTHRNNNYENMKIPSKIKELYADWLSYKYVPLFTPESKIISKVNIPKLWDIMPSDVKFKDGILLFDKTTSPDADLQAIYDICVKNVEYAIILFIIETNTGEIFGGIMGQNIQFYDDGKYRTPYSAYLFSVEPEIKLYMAKDRRHDEIVCFEPGALRFGNGEDGPAITIDSELKVGWTNKDSVFGNDAKLLKDYTNFGEFEIKNMEIYLMQ